MDQPNTSTVIASLMAKLNANQAKFVLSYCLHGNQTKAAREAGYSERSAENQGYRMMRNDEVLAAISAVMEQMGMSKGEAVKHMTDIARTRLNKYLTVRRVKRPTKVRKHLTELIVDLHQQIEFDNEYAERAGFDEDEMKSHQNVQKSRFRQILRYQMQLEKDPYATAEVDGDPEEVEQVDLDLVALARAEDEGRIKSLSFTEYGPKVEMYPADSALDKILQLHGAYKQVPGDAGAKSRAVYTLPDGTTLEF